MEGIAALARQLQVDGRKVSVEHLIQTKARQSAASEIKCYTGSADSGTTGLECRIHAQRISSG